MLPDTLFLPGYLSTIPTILKKKFFWSFLESGEEYSWTPFGQRPSQGSHLFTPFFSTSILSAGQLLTHEVPSTKKLAKQRKQKLSPITTWTTFVARIKAKEKLKFKLRKKKKKLQIGKNNSRLWVCGYQEAFVGTHGGTGPHRWTQTGTWRWGWAPAWRCTCCKWGPWGTEVHRSPSR